MSTASKVLVVLVMLLTMGWIVLVSAVATVNRAYGEKVVQQREALAKKDEDRQKLRIENSRVKVEAETAQDLVGLQAKNLQGQLETSIAQRSVVQQIQNRLGADQQDMSKASDVAAKNLEFRKDEVTKHQDEQKQLEASVEETKKQNQALRKELDGLQADFKKLLEDNQRSTGSNGGL